MRIALLILVLSVSRLQAGIPADTSKFKQHLNFNDVFFGNEDAFQVCYPKDHKVFFYNIIILSIAVVVLLSLFLYNRTKNARLHKLNAELLSQKNKDILDSINYARHIQNTVLPDENTLKILGEHFVFYKPKDIVSGDFYYVFKGSDYLILSVVDCTGHGVPGAFLSLVGQTALNRAVRDEKLTNPTEIMDRMNSFVKETLNQNDEDALRDGMEVAICHICNKTNRVQFAGATRSIIHVSNGEAKTYTGDKCTVGSYQPHVKQAPVTHVLDAKKGDMIYLFSDGITDQFGGPSNKKIKKEIFADLNSVHGMDTNNQKNHFEKKLRNWQGKNEQTDDMVLIGYRIA